MLWLAAKHAGLRRTVITVRKALVMLPVTSEARTFSRWLLVPSSNSGVDAVSPDGLCHLWCSSVWHSATSEPDWVLLAVRILAHCWLSPEQVEEREERGKQNGGLYEEEEAPKLHRKAERTLRYTDTTTHSKETPSFPPEEEPEFVNYNLNATEMHPDLFKRTCVAAKILRIQMFVMTIKATGAHERFWTNLFPIFAAKT